MQTFAFIYNITMTIKRFFIVFSVLCALSVNLAFSQSMNWSVSAIQASQKSGSSSNGQVKAAPKASAAVRVGPAETFKELVDSVGTDISNMYVAMKHADFHIYAMGAAPLKVGLTAKRDAIISLGVLGSGDSPLVGHREYVSRIYGALLRQKSYLQDKMLSIALVGNANFNLEPTASAYLVPLPDVSYNIGSYALKFLKNVAIDNKNDFYTRRFAIALIGSFRRTEAVKALRDCLKQINTEQDSWSVTAPATWFTEPKYDTAMAFDKEGRLFENYDGSDETEKGALIVSVISALDSLIDSPAQEGSLKMMRFFAGLAQADARNTVYQDIATSKYKEMGGSHIAYLSSLYMLARRGLVHSSIQQHPQNKYNYYEANPEGRRVTAVIHDVLYGNKVTQGYLCDTRTAFYKTYKNMTSYWNGWRGFYTPPNVTVSYPANYSERNCKTEHFTEAIMLETSGLLFGKIEKLKTVVTIINIVKCSNSLKKMKGKSDFANIFNAVSDCSSLTKYEKFADTLDVIGRTKNVANTR